MLNFEQIQGLMQDRDISVLSEKTEIHRNTLIAVKNGTAKGLHSRTHKKLSDYFLEEKNIINGEK